MTWSAATADGRRDQFGRFLLGTGNIGGIATTTGPGIGLSDDEGLALIDRALVEGARVIDTADVYTGGTSERVVGRWLREHADADVLVQTKTGMTPDGPNLSPERVQRQLDHALEVLGRVDLFVAHTVDPNTPWADTLRVFSDAVQSGRVRAYGLSNVTEQSLTDALEAADRDGLVRPEIVQNQYSLVVREDDRGVLPIVQREGLAYTPFSPLANGILAGRYSAGERPAHGSRATASAVAPGLLDDPDVIARVRRFDDLAADLGVTPAGLALGWIMNRPDVTAPIVGISKPTQWLGVQQGLALEWTAELDARLAELFPAGAAARR
ncbi:aldo/keto reductase [Jatrophihabitans endophyticus]|uniref:aldo/keto reductase n=1 Tax=Jatrophihabitans endophyticus TaxID=1206085 RepID=UPI0019FE368D|nr:aldo/keto reductase [Jatrophihabitans endophyticus]MBE7190204.1 aldo/keto reductase [Jatrophihabitans endophyticus]